MIKYYKIFFAAERIEERNTIMNINENISTLVTGEYDVILVGGGPSGAVAGIAAARAGAKTLVLEREFYLGGMWTGGFVNPLFD